MRISSGHRNWFFFDKFVMWMNVMSVWWRHMENKVYRVR